MKDGSEGEQEAEFIEIDNQKAIKGKSQSERTEELRKMMDESGIAILDVGYIPRYILTMNTDEEMQGTGESPSQHSEPIATPKEDASPSPAITTLSGSSRRRGRRKIMKKKTIKDEEGYLGLCISISPSNNQLNTNLLHLR